MKGAGSLGEATSRHTGEARLVQELQTVQDIGTFVEVFGPLHELLWEGYSGK